MITALCAAFMMVTAAFPYLSYSMPAIVGILLVIVVIELNMKWAFGVYAAVSLLTLILPDDKEAVLFFIFFFGYYGILKARIEGLKIKPVEYILKLALFNAGVVIATLITVFVLHIPMETIEMFGKYTPLALLAAGNIIFLIYDFALTGLITKYLYLLHSRVERMLK